MTDRTAAQSRSVRIFVSSTFRDILAVRASDWFRNVNLPYFHGHPKPPL